MSGLREGKTLQEPARHARAMSRVQILFHARERLLSSSLPDCLSRHCRSCVGDLASLKYVVGVKSDNIILTVMVLVGLLFGVWSIRYAKMIWLNIDLTIHPPNREDYEQRNRNSVQLADKPIERRRGRSIKPALYPPGGECQSTCLHRVIHRLGHVSRDSPIRQWRYSSALHRLRVPSPELHPMPCLPPHRR